MKIKRLIAMLLCIALLLSLAACGKKSSSKKSSSTKKSSSSSQTNSDSKKSTSNTDAEPTETEAATTSNWEKAYYVDEFEQPTSEGYITNSELIVGTFSNSATTNSTLYVKFTVDKKYVAIALAEYGSYVVKNSSSKYSDSYKIILQSANGTKYNLTGELYPGGDRIVIDTSYNATILSALKSGGEIKLYIEETEYSTSNYLFTVDTTGFAEAYKTL